MKLRTSFFNTAVLKKDITRFAPAWGLYLTAMLLLMVTITEENYDLAGTLGMTINLLSIVNLGYALVCAALLFGDLFNSKLCNALHAMPMRREGWFLTHLVSGLMFSVVPNLVVGLCLMPRLGVYWFVSLIWVGGMTATYLFFFGVAVLSAMCTGSRFAMTLVYGLINFLSILVMWVIQYLFIPLLYGVEVKEELFIFLSPVSYLCSHELNYLNFLDKITGYYNPNNGWPYTLGIGAIGLVMLIGSLLIYRKRQLESAGDFITLRALSPVFLVLYTLAAGVFLFIFSSVFGIEKEYLFLAVGIVAGFITGQMLLKRTVRIFKPATILGLVMMLLVVFGSLGLAKLDVLGMVRWVPKAENVRAVSVGYGTDVYIRDEYAYTTAQQAEIRALIALHEAMLEQREDAPTWVSKFELTYTMEDGRIITRSYPMHYTTQASHDAARWLSRPEYVLQTDDVAALADRLNYIMVDFHDGKNTIPLAEDEAQELLAAIIADCEAGNMVTDGYYHGLDDTAEFMNGDISLYFINPDHNVFLSLWSSQKNTLAWLREHGFEREA